MNDHYWLVELTLALLELILRFLFCFILSFIKVLFVITFVHILFVEFAGINFDVNFCVVNSALITLGYCLFLTYAIFKEVIKNGDKKEN